MLKAPFPYFGGKSRIAAQVWTRLGNPASYIEPFAGSLAVLLGRPHPPRHEVVNDLHGDICNVWRAIRNDPERVAQTATYPANEIDLNARNRFLIANPIAARLLADPEWCDVRRAAWWLWGQSLNMSHWGTDTSQAKPITASGYWQGIHKLSLRDTGLLPTFYALAERLRHTTILHGGWQRALAPAHLPKYPAAIFLDPPYAHIGRDTNLYPHDHPDLFHDVVRWCAAHGQHPQMRIALCGYADDPESVLPGWAYERWATQGGFANIGKQRRENKYREVIWYSPGCQNAQLFLQEAAVG